MSQPAGRAIHVLHVVPMLRRGGMELAMSRLLHGLGEPEFRHSIVCLKGEVEVADLLPAGITLRCLHAKDNELGLPRRLRALLKADRPDVVHARNWGSWPDVALARLGLRPRVPLIFSFHGLDKPGPLPWRRRLACRLLQRITDLVFAVSDASRQMLVGHVGLREPVAVLPNGVDTVRFAPAPRPRGPRLVVGTVGHLLPVKNQPLLLRAAAQVRSRGLDLEVRIAGTGPEEARLRDLARELRLEERLVFAGRIEDVPGFLRGLDVFVLPSDSEGHPNALMEAMACGLPVVGTRVGGIAEVLQQGRCGRLVERGDAAALAREIEALARDPGGAEELGRLARERAVARYGMARMVSEYGGLYRAVVAGQRWRPALDPP